ncbi:hypothetical protein [Algisphaera agarilytica]|uniref:Tetratricopeptide repeat-containing protein n=1 Tax=Algisphaera agarilytica TaxID=1385975 RepID=A0A7X0H973_9BACT|nr:hypothetical protein [Algisphaera agarilytica]MBB6431600.1 hypothetical protein [Algisphaera agarilytica]
MNHATLHHALTAMHAGRLDEAANLLTQPSIRPHRRAQDALTELCKRLVQRGREHLGAERWAEARSDAQRVLSIEPGQAEAAELLAQVAQERAAQQRQERCAADGLAYAKRLADLGQSTRAREAAPELGSVAGKRLVEHLDLRKLERQALIERGEAALERNDFVGAAHVVERLAAFPPSSESDVLKHALHTHAAQSAEDHLRAGQPDEALTLLKLTGASETLTQVCHDLQAAAVALDRGDAAVALPPLQRAARHFRGVDWLDDAIAQTKSLRDAQEALIAGPIGALAEVGGATSNVATQAATRAVGYGYRSMTDSPHQAVAASTLSQSPLILHQDGQPLAVLCATPQVSLGTTGASVLPLIASESSHPLTFTRDEEGHLVQASSDLTVNQQPATHALLTHQDRLGVGPRIKLRYLRANPASQTAVLELTAGRFTTPNLRRVVLLSGELLIGPHRGCHLRDPKLPHPVTFRPTADGLAAEGVPLVPGGPEQTIHGQAWSVTSFDLSSA